MSKNEKTAAVTGATGRHGGYLAKHLLDAGYHVFGTSRDAQMSLGGNLGRLAIAAQVALHAIASNDFRSVLKVFERVRSGRHLQYPESEFYSTPRLGSRRNDIIFTLMHRQLMPQ